MLELFHRSVAGSLIFCLSLTSAWAGNAPFTHPQRTIPPYFAVQALAQTPYAEVPALTFAGEKNARVFRHQARQRPMQIAASFIFGAILSIAAHSLLWSQERHAVNTPAVIRPAIEKLKLEHVTIERNLESANDQWEALLMPLVEKSALDLPLTQSQRLRLLKIRLLTEGVPPDRKDLQVVLNTVQKAVNATQKHLSEMHSLLNLRFSIHVGGPPVSAEEWKTILNDFSRYDDLQNRCTTILPTAIATNQWTFVLFKEGYEIEIYPTRDPSGKMAFLQATRIWKEKKEKDHMHLVDYLQHSLGALDGTLIHINSRRQTATTRLGMKIPVINAADPDFPWPPLKLSSRRMGMSS